jgi:tetratricopeptide (TPR) repeat protein
MTSVLWADVQTPAARLDAARALLKQKQIAQAAAILDGVRADLHLTPVQRFDLGWLYGQARRYRTAIGIFESLPESVPDPVTHHYAIALAFFNLGEYGRSAKVLAQAKERGFSDAKSANLLGVAYAKAGDAEKAYEALRDGTTQTSADVDGYFNLVTLCVDFGNNALAEKIATQGIAAFPSDHRLLVSRGAIRLAGGETVGARADFGRALELAPGDADAVFFSALAEYNSGQFGSATAILRKSVREGSADADIHYLLAESLLRTSPAQPDEASREVNAAVRMDGELVPALLLRAKLNLNTAATTSAVADLEKARRLEPENRGVIYTLARAYQKAGRNSEAKALFESVRQDSETALSEMSRKKVRHILVERAE